MVQRAAASVGLCVSVSVLGGTGGGALGARSDGGLVGAGGDFLVARGGGGWGAGGTLGRGALVWLGEAETGAGACGRGGGVFGHGAEFGDAVGEGFGGYVCVGGWLGG